MTIPDLLGEGTDLSVLQMSVRAILFFFITLILIRISGRRSLGLHTSVDTIIMIILGSIIIRGIVGASPILPVMVACLVIVLLHRLLGWLISKSRAFAKLVEGDKILLYSQGQFIKKGMAQALLSEEDILQGVRKSALTENLDKIDLIYMERNGDISAIKKKES